MLSAAARLSSAGGRQPTVCQAGVGGEATSGLSAVADLVYPYLLVSISRVPLRRSVAAPSSKPVVAIIPVHRRYFAQNSHRSTDNSEPESCMTGPVGISAAEFLHLRSSAAAAYVHETKNAPELAPVP